MKDNFSTASGGYAKFRPNYPQAIFDFLYPLLKERQMAWDCGTGNGQIAQELAKDFQQIEATDISQSQLDHAYTADNIRYSLQAAEATDFGDDIFDLITVGQAVHWFDFDKFNNEVNRVATPNAIIAILGYELNNITPAIDQIVRRFYTEVIGEYWDPERQHLETRYQRVPFPFKELETPEIYNIKLWSFDTLIGYLKTWSAVQHFIQANGYDPVDEISSELKYAWGSSEVRKVSFPIIFRVGRVK
jgi:SAM-dependent methyltransferase